jgi:hypothetical protein
MSIICKKILGHGGIICGEKAIHRGGGGLIVCDLPPPGTPMVASHFFFHIAQQIAR